MLLKARWWSGPEPALGSAFVAATLFHYTDHRALPGVIRNSRRLATTWSSRPGAIALRTALDPRRASSLSVSAWTDEAGLRAFLTSPMHRAVATRYKLRVARITSVLFEVETFSYAQVWSEGLARVRAASARGEGRTPGAHACQLGVTRSLRLE